MKDIFSIVFDTKNSETAKREVLYVLASLYVPLDMVVPKTLVGTSIFRQICEEQRDWDSELTDKLKKNV